MNADPMGLLVVFPTPILAPDDRPWWIPWWWPYDPDEPDGPDWSEIRDFFKAVGTGATYGVPGSEFLAGAEAASGIARIWFCRNKTDRQEYLVCEELTEEEDYNYVILKIGCHGWDSLTDKEKQTYYDKNPDAALERNED